MRASFAALILLSAGCGPGSPLVGTWRYAADVRVQSSPNDTTKMAMFDLELGPTAAADLVVWKVGGGCNVPLTVVGKVASLGAEGAPLCGLSVGAMIPLLALSGTTVKANDQLGIKAARFEVLDSGKLSTTFNYKLFTDLKDSRVGPEITVSTTTATHGTRLK